MQGSAKETINPAKVLAGGSPAWPKDAHTWEKAVGENEIVYEDSRVVVFHDPVDDPHESTRVSGELRLTLITKKHVESLLDLGVHDESLGAAILHGIQQAAYRLGLEKKGFEVRSFVYPPLQHRPGLAFRIRSGKAPKTTTTG